MDSTLVRSILRVNQEFPESRATAMKARPNLTMWLATIEVLAVITAAIVVFRLLAASPIHSRESDLLGKDGFFASSYAAVIALVAAVQLARRRNLAEIGLSLAHPRRVFETTVIGFLPFMAFGGALSLVNWRLWPGAAIAAGGALVLLVVLGLAMRRSPGAAATMAAAISVNAPALASARDGAADVVMRAAYTYLLVAPAEEILFRGYTLGRLSDAWGSPRAFCGVRWGLGAVLSSALFGLWHVALMPAAAGVWSQALWTALVGLSLCYVRERAGSIVPSSLLHGVINYMPLATVFGR